MNLNLILTAVVWLSCVYLLINFALIILTAKTILELKDQIRRHRLVRKQ